MFFRRTVLVVSQVVLGLLAGSALTACQGEADDPWAPEEPELLDELRVPVVVPMAPSGEGGSYAAARAVAGGSASDVEIGIAGGRIELWATAEGFLVVDHLEIEGTDIVIGADVVPPAGVHLTGLRARLQTPVAVEPTVREDRLTAIARLNLVVEWSIVVNGQAHPLAPLHLDELPFSIEVDRTRPGWTIRLVAFRDGRFWAFADLWELADLTLDLYARGGQDL